MQTQSGSQRVPMDPLLYKAASEGDINLLEELLKDKGENVQPGDVAIHVTTGFSYANGRGRSISCLQGTTYSGNTALHIAASFGHLEVVKIICLQNKSLHLRGNRKSETPLHYAAQAGRPEIVSQFIQFTDVEPQGQNPFHLGGVDAQKELLRRRNRDGETALYQAVHNKNLTVVQQLIGADLHLASIPDNSGTSPMYLAAVRMSLEIVRFFIDSLPGDMSQQTFAGPDGQTILHALALTKKGAGVVHNILNWKPELANTVDNAGSTPLHYAVSVRNMEAVELLLENDRSSAYFADSCGIFPVHVAVKLGYLDVVIRLFELCPDSDELLDAQEKNLLHIAVEEKHVHVVQWVSNNSKLVSALNAKDDKGNTPMHLAIKARDVQIFSLLLGNKKVDKGIMNKDGLTPLDLAAAQMTVGLMHWQNPEYIILQTLKGISSGIGMRRFDHFLKEYKLTMNQEKIDMESESHGQMAKNLSIGAVLIASASFAGVFAVSDSYKAEVLAGHKSPGMSLAFKAFTLLISYAFLCSITATGLLTVAALTILDQKYHRRNILNCIDLVMLAVKGLVAAFALGAYVTLSPVSKWLAVFVCLTGVAVPVFLHPLQFPNIVVSKALTKLVEWRELLRTKNVPDPRTPVAVKHRAFWERALFVWNGTLFGFIVLIVLAGSLINLSTGFLHSMVLACVIGLLFFTCIRFFFVRITDT